LLSERQLTNSILEAFEKDEFILHYQPQVAIDSQKCVGVEALIRWDHPSEGLLTPNQFLHIINKEDLIRKLDFYVCHKAIEQLIEWDKEGFEIDKISVNITSITLLDPRVESKVEELLDKYDFEPQKICVEVTEDYSVEDHERLQEVLVYLKALGFVIAMDDFGTGYSSLNYIVKYPIDIIKIDKSLVDNIVYEKQDYEFLCGIIEVLNTLGKRVVCEGIESVEQLEKIIHFKDLIIQGYYYGKPMSKSSIIEFIQQ